MSSTRKTISIHDYPEHLNPFSEPTVPLRKTGKVFVDRLNMSGTWSSKITKRVNRSVTWIEKSWLGIEDSKKYKIQSAKTGANVKSSRADSSKSITQSSPQLTADSNSDEKRDCDYQQVRERIRKTIVNPNEMISSEKRDEERKEIKKKKKRPAPQPPNAGPNSCSTSSENSHSTSVFRTNSSEKNEEIKNSSTDAASIENHSVSLSPADSGICCRPFSDSSAYEPSSPCKSENEDSDSQGRASADGRPDECAVPTTTISRPNRPSRNKDDGEMKLGQSRRNESESPKLDAEERCTSEECSNSPLNANDGDYDDDDDEVFVNATIPTPTECKKGEITDVPSCETKKEESCPLAKIENCNNAAVQV